MFADLHCDLISRAEGPAFRENGFCHTDLRRLAALSALAGMSVFVLPRPVESVAERAFSLLKALRKALEKNADLALPLLWRGEVLPPAGKTRLFLHLEGAELLAGDAGAVEQLFRLGLRSLSLTWNYANAAAGGCLEPGPLLPPGRAMIGELERLGMALDLAHLAPEAFWQALALAKKPPYVSHAACAGLCPNPRNLTDEMLRALAEKGGILGVCFVPDFLSPGGGADAEAVLAHIAHAVDQMGVEGVAFGSDFDGTEQLPAGIRGVDSLPLLAEGLRQKGYSAADVEKICGTNAVRYWTEILPARPGKEEDR